MMRSTTGTLVAIGIGMAAGTMTSTVALTMIGTAGAIITVTTMTR